ncbi:hypothetical protein VNO80_16912 [Phaseolus coccineus]|uniref:Uncharacterized protein n=1 Tax=Phaseolus coccineus TaxID=3886 RepID=A0AAN9R367_PHACN
MKGKVKSSKLKFGIPAFFFLCSLFFFDLDDVGSKSRILQESEKKVYEPVEHGESGESFFDSIPFQVNFLRFLSSGVGSVDFGWLTI